MPYYYLNPRSITLAFLRAIVLSVCSLSLSTILQDRRVMPSGSGPLRILNVPVFISELSSDLRAACYSKGLSLIA